MSNLEQDDSKVMGEMALGESTKVRESALSQVWTKSIRSLDAFLDGIYRNRWDADPPKGIAGQVWGMPSITEPFPWASDSPIGNIQPAEFYFLHYFQSQGYGPTTNECVTTSALMSMNMLKDLVALRHGHPIEPDRNIAEYTRDLDALGLRGWRYRFPTKSPFPGMMTPWQAISALKDFAASLEEKYGKSYRVKLNARHKLLDIIEQLREGNIILVHGAWQMTLDRNNKKLGYKPLLAFLGGMPHTMLLIGYDGDASQWLLLNPADPWPDDKHKPVTPRLYKMDTRQLMDFWGRKFLFYPPRFALTMITLDA
jgi:hypothetical protein